MEEQEGGAMDDLSRAEDILIYPNPNTGTFTVRVHEQGAFEVLNSIGQVLQTQWVNEGTVAFEVNGLPAGVYFVRGVSNPSNLQRVVVLN
jgi:hypothetical protein